MVMKKIKPKYGKVVPPAVEIKEKETSGEDKLSKKKILKKTAVAKNSASKNKSKDTPEIVQEASSDIESEETDSTNTANLNPFLQTKDVLKQTDLTKIGYRMRSEYVELLDIQKKLKKGGYTLEAVLDDALTYYFEHSEEGKEAVKKAEIFYS